LTTSRRNFVYGSAAVAGLSLTARLAHSLPLGLPLGIQLYSVRDQMKDDLDAALAAIRDAGFKQVEAAALPKKTAKEIRAALDRAGLDCVSAHHPFGDIQPKFDEVIAFDKELGVKFVICSSPGYKDAPAPGSKPRPYSLDDWKYNAEHFDRMGEKAKAVGVKFGYHNHTREFVLTEGKTPYFELLRMTDPALVTFELDCGWAVVGGKNPADLLRDYPHRISMLHVKDFIALPANAAPGQEPLVTELGKGSIDYKPVFAQAAKTQHIQHAFVEQEAFDMPWKDSLKVDAEYMRKLKV
jgi:sugar phosphate isomerase/epimerase